MKFKFNYLILAAFLTANFSAKAIPTPEAIEPQYDDDGNPTISVSPATVSENTSSVSVDVSLSFLTPLVVTVDYATSDGSLAEPHTS